MSYCSQTYSIDVLQFLFIEKTTFAEFEEIYE